MYYFLDMLCVNNPIVAIELDDSSHMREDRAKRDSQIEAIFAGTDMPLVRIPWQQSYDNAEVTRQIEPYLRTRV